MSILIKFKYFQDALSQNNSSYLQDLALNELKFLNKKETKKLLEKINSKNNTLGSKITMPQKQMSAFFDIKCRNVRLN